MASCVPNYSPQPPVAVFHRIPHTNISFQDTQSIVEGSLAYFEAVIIWCCLPLIVGLVLFILMMVYNCLVCCCCCTDEVFNSKKKAKICAGFGLIWIVIGILFIGGCLYIEVEVNRNVNKVATFMQQSRASQQAIQNLNTSIDSVQFNVEINRLIGRAAPQPAADEGDRLKILVTSLVQTQTRAGVLVESLQLTPASDVFSIAETTRHWVVMGLLIAMALTFIALFVVFLCMKPTLLLCVLVLATILMIISWFALALGFAGTIVLSDFCFDPEGTMRSTQQQLDQQNQVGYYLVCDGSCNNSYAEVGRNLTVLYVSVGESIDILTGMLSSNDSHLSTVTAMLTGSNSSYQAVEPAFTCDSTFSIWTDARDSACGNGFVYMLSLFAVLGGLVFVFLMLLCHGTAYFGFLRATEDEGLYDFTSKTDTFMPKNFAGDYASSTWSRPQPAMLGGAMSTAGTGTSTVVDMEPSVGQQQQPRLSQRLENHEMQAFDTLNLRVVEPPAYSEAYEEIDVQSDHMPRIEHAEIDDV